MEDGSTVEVGLVSNEGMVCIPVILGDTTTITNAVVQIPDTAMQIDADILRSQFKRGTALQSLMLRYVQGVIHSNSTRICLQPSSSARGAAGGSLAADSF